jgi:pyrroline-5-carboxylate reductase
MNISEKCFGFLGCGKISSAVCRGYASHPDASKRPRRILVSKRSVDKSSALAEDFPGMVEIVENDQLVAESDVIFVGLLPQVAREIMPTLPFDESKHQVVSMMAAVDYAEVLALTRMSAANVVRTVPLPSNAKRLGPILVHPKNEVLQSMLDCVGAAVLCETEAAMKPLVAITGHIATFYELMKCDQDWAMQNGVSGASARKFVSSFYSSLAVGADTCPDSFEDLIDHASTPGGLNAQVRKCESVMLLLFFFFSLLLLLLQCNAMQCNAMQCNHHCFLTILSLSLSFSLSFSFACDCSCYFPHSR